MHAFGRALLWACILANGLVHAQPATVADEGARLTAELIRLQQDSVREADARTRLEALQSRIAAVASYPVQRELAKLRIRLAEDDGERERLRDGLIALAERHRDPDTASVVRVWRIFDSHVDDNIEVSLRALDALRLGIAEPSAELREALDVSYGYMYWDVGNFELALRHLLQARAEARRLPDGERRWRRRTESIAQIHTDMGDAAQALAELDRLEGTGGDSIDLPAIATRATALRLQDRPRDAEAMLWPVLGRLRPGDSANVAQRVRAELAGLLLQRGQAQRALGLARQMIDASREGSAYYRAAGQVLQGRALARLGRVDEGLASMHSGIDYFRTAGHQVTLLRVLGEQAEVLQAAGRHREAATAMADRHRIVMRLYNSNRALGIASLEVEEKLGERERQIRELSSRSRLQAAELRAGQSTSLALLAGVLLSLALIALLAMSLRNLRRQREALWRDPLTGTYNRQYFSQWWESHPVSDGQARTLALLDLDHFKAVNDRHGHEGGDHVLRASGERLRARVGAGAMVFRWGGEEFLIVRDNPAARDEAAWLADLQYAIAQPVELAGAAIRITASIGAFVAGAAWWSGADVATALRWADAGLYRAKADRRANAVLLRLTREGRERLTMRAPEGAVQLEEWARKGWVIAESVRLPIGPPDAYPTMSTVTDPAQANADLAPAASGQST